MKLSSQNIIGQFMPWMPPFGRHCVHPTCTCTALQILHVANLRAGTAGTRGASIRVFGPDAGTVLRDQQPEALMAHEPADDDIIESVPVHEGSASTRSD